MRLHLVLKTSTEESSRTLGAVLQDQWRRVGIDLELRSLETATLLSDVGKGNFQLYTLRWIGGNDDPDIFEFIFSSRRMPPDGANRGHYRNPRVDALLVDQARVEPDREKRRQLFSQVQRIVAEDLPYLNFSRYMDNVSVHRRRVEPASPSRPPEITIFSTESAFALPHNNPRSTPAPRPPISHHSVERRDSALAYQFFILRSAATRIHPAVGRHVATSFESYFWVPHPPPHPTPEYIFIPSF